MSDTLQQMAQAADSPENEDETSAKVGIYTTIGDHVKSVTDKRIGKTGGRVIFDLVVGEIFAACAKDKSFRFNGGFGSMHLRTYTAGSRRLPSGQETTFGERNKIRYEEGVVVKTLIGNGGDLKAALAARASRTREPGEVKQATATVTTAPTPIPAQTKGKRATKVATKAATPATTPADIELD